MHTELHYPAQPDPIGSRHHNRFQSSPSRLPTGGVLLWFAFATSKHLAALHSRGSEQFASEQRKCPSPYPATKSERVDLVDAANSNYVTTPQNGA